MGKGQEGCFGDGGFFEVAPSLQLLASGQGYQKCRAERFVGPQGGRMFIANNIPINVRLRGSRTEW